MKLSAADAGSAAASDGQSTSALIPKAVAGHGTGFAKALAMANQAQQLETASTKQNRNIKPVAPKELQKRPPVKQLPPPDEDVLIFLPIG